MADKTENTWQVVSANQASYQNLTADEVTFQGTMIVENYGKPGVSYVRAPHNYWLELTEGKTGKDRVALGINDTAFPPLDRKRVEVKGKWQPKLLDDRQLYVGWIRALAPETENETDN